MTVVAYRIANYDTPVSPTPSSRSGRYHRAGGPPAHYWALHPHGPWAEISRWHGGVDPEYRGRLWAACICVVPTVITFSTAPEYGLAAGDLVADDHTACQQLADRLRTEGHTAIQVPSAALPGTSNLVLLDDRIQIDYLDEPVDTIDLPAAIAADRAVCQPEIADFVRHHGSPHLALQTGTGDALRYDQPQPSR